MDNKKRILKNTIFLYIRSLFTLIISLYSSRLILEALGVENFGVYQLVGGVVAAVSFLNSTLSSATQRFLAYEIGLGNSSKIQKTFSMAVNVHLIFSLILFAVIMGVGAYLLNNHLDIGSVNKMDAILVLLFSALSMVLTVNSVPYNSFLVAQENMAYFAYIDIFGALLKLGVVFLLFVFDSKRLVLYALFLFIVSFIVQVLYYTVCRIKYGDARYSRFWDAKLAKTMLSFSGWTSLSAFAYMIRTQGLSIILNIFFGPLLNAAIGISNQVNAAVRTFSQNFQMSFAPQIVKSYARSEYEKMNNLIFSGAKLSTYLLIIFSLPIIIETDYILHLWLKTVPPYAPLIVKLVLIETIIATLTCTGNQAIRSTGNVKFFELSYNLFEIFSLPLIILILYFFKVYYLPLVIIILFMFLSSFIKLHFLKKQIPGFNMKNYVLSVMAVTIILTIISVIFPTYLCNELSPGFVRFVINSLVFEISFWGLVIWKGLNQAEREMLKGVVNKIIKK